MAPDLSCARAVVVGNGNVAVDAARMLVTDPDVLARTDIADHALTTLRPCGVKEVLLLGRRGPLQSAFTTLELRELGELEGVDVVVDPADLEGISDDAAAAAGKIAKNNIKVLREYAGRTPTPTNRRIVLRFFTSPIEIKGDGKVDSIVLGRNELITDASGRMVANDTGTREEVPVQLVVRSVGYRGMPVPGLAFDQNTGTIPHTNGRIENSCNEYVAGWIKRGPSGVIGTNKKCSQETADTLLSDLSATRDCELANRAGTPQPYADELAEWLASRQPQLVTAAHWRAIDRFERKAGEPHGRPRTKLASLTELLGVAHG
jgi:ferredoxin--NADP+ reductase